MNFTRQQPVQILVAEDNSPDVLLVRMALDARGLRYQLHHVQDGEQAIEFVHRADSDETAPRPEVLLLDMNLPRKEGDEVLREVRQSRTCAAIPVIILTSSDSPPEIERAMALGATRYFCKPSDLKEFIALGGVVEEVLQMNGG